MIPLIAMLFTNLIINNTCFNNVNGSGSLLNCTNNGIVASANLPVSDPLGLAILFMVFIILTSVASFRTDLPLAAAFASLVCVGISLLLATPGLALIGPNIIYLFIGLTLLFMLLALLKGTRSPYR